VGGGGGGGRGGGWGGGGGCGGGRGGRGRLKRNCWNREGGPLMGYAFEFDALELFDADTAKRAASAARSEVAELPDRIWQAAPLSLLGSKLQEKCGSVLANIDLFKLFVDGWGKIEALQALCDPEIIAKGTVRHVKLVKVEQSVPIDLTVSLHFGPIHTTLAKFKIKFTGKFGSVECAVRRGHLIAVGGGDCELWAAIDHKSGQIKKKFRLKRFDLPLEYTFTDPGIRIPHRAPKPAAAPPPLPEVDPDQGFHLQAADLDSQPGKPHFADAKTGERQQCYVGHVKPTFRAS